MKNEDVTPDTLEHFVLFDKPEELDHIARQLFYSLQYSAADSDQRIEQLKMVMALHEQCAAIQLRQWGTDSPHTALSLHNIGYLLLHVGKPAEAIPFLTKALEVREKVVGRDGIEFALTSYVLGISYQEVGDNRRALKYCQDAIAGYASIYGEDSEKVSDILKTIEALSAIKEPAGTAVPEMSSERIPWNIFAVDSLDTADRCYRLGSFFNDFGDKTRAALYLRAMLIIRERSIGNDDVKGSIGHQTFGTILGESGNIEEAIRHFDAALNTRLRIFGLGHMATFVTLESLANIYHLLGDLNKAEGYYEQALESAELIFADDLKATKMAERDADTSVDKYREARSSLGGVLERLVKLKAVDVLMVASTRNKKRMGDVQPFTVWALSALGQALFLSGSHEEGISKSSEAATLSLVVWGDQSADAAKEFLLLGQLYLQAGQLRYAHPALEQAFSFWQRSGGADDALTAVFCGALAHLYSEEGDLGCARIMAEKSVTAMAAAFGEAAPDTAASRGHLGFILGRLGCYKQAQEAFRESLQILGYNLEAPEGAEVQLEDPLALANVLKYFAEFLVEMGDSGSAMGIYQRVFSALRAAHANDDVFAGVYGNVGIILKSAGRYKEARPYLEKAADFYLRNFGEKNIQSVKMINNLGTLYHAMGMYEPALERLERAVKLAVEIGSEADTMRVVVLHNLAALETDFGEYGSALAHFQESATTLDTLGNPNQRVKLLNGIASVQAAMGAHDEALSTLESAMATYDGILRGLFPAASERQRAFNLMINKGMLDSYFTLAMKSGFLFSHAATAYDKLLGRKGLGTEALAIQRDAVLGSRHPELLNELKELQDVRTRVARLVMLSEEELPKPGDTELKTLIEQKERLEVFIAGRVPELSLEAFFATDHQEVLRSLPSGTVLVEYLVFTPMRFGTKAREGALADLPDRYLAFVIRNNSPDPVLAFDLGPCDPVDKLIHRFRHSIENDVETDSVTDDEVTVSYRQWGRKLRSAVFDPIRHYLNSTHVIFAPDGLLNLVPFETLQEEDGSYLIDHFFFTYLPVGRDVVKLVKRYSGEVTAPIVLANPDFDLSPGEPSSLTAPIFTNPLFSSLSFYALPGTKTDGQPFPALPGTENEGKRIGKHLEVKPLLGKQAVKTRLKEAKAPLILHLATHGFFLRSDNDSKEGGGHSWNKSDHPLLRSGLALTGANDWLKGIKLSDDAEDGLLTAEDVAGLDLLGTELVVLSACDTGIGTVETGEGVFGLRRSFLLAGAASVVCSMWKIADNVVVQMMETFYERLLAGEPRCTALRGAALTVRSRYPHPLYWGGFICLGNYYSIHRPGTIPVSSQSGNA